MIYQVYTQKLVKSDKFKSGTEQHLDKQITKTESRDVIIGKIPVMVRSNLCWMKEVEKGDCEFDQGGYFIIKGAEKVSSELLWFISCITFNFIVKSIIYFP